MFCTNCGEKIEDGYLFCTNCGEKVDLLDLSPSDKTDLVLKDSDVSSGELTPDTSSDAETPLAVTPKKKVIVHVNPKPEEPAQEPEIMRFCTNCGEPLEPGFQFCTNCGQPIGEDEAGIPISKDANRENSKEEKKARQKKQKKEKIPKEKPVATKGRKAQNIAIAVLLLLALLLGAALYFVFSGRTLDFLPGGNTSLSEVDVDSIKEASTTKESTTTANKDDNPPSAIELRKDNNEWYAYRNGNKASDYTGFATNDSGDWYVKNGKVDFLADGVFKKDDAWVKVTKGKVDYSFSGIASNEHGKWYVEKGYVNFSFSGKIAQGGTSYDVEDGKVL